jgi:hypothetical protein
MIVEYPTKLVSALNAREHHMTRHRRVKRERANARLKLQSGVVKQGKPALPASIVVTRLGPRLLDAHDNLGASAKGVVDEVCAWLGVRDDDQRVSIDVRQEKAKDYRVRIEVTHVE